MDASRHDHALGLKEKRFPRKQTCLSIYSRCINSADSLDHTLAAFFPWCIEWEQELRLLFKSYTEAKQERHVLDTTISSSIGFICLAMRRSSRS